MDKKAIKPTLAQDNVPLYCRFSTTLPASIMIRRRTVSSGYDTIAAINVET